VARLAGWAAPELSGARVLEVGCGRGGNLLAMALSLPATGFVGVERSPRQAKEARSLAGRLGLSNVTIREESFEGPGLLPDEGGTSEGFDYVVAHGVASWVSPETRRTLLQRIGRWLSPGGVAYVSFNALPGWYDRLAARDWLRFSAGEDPGASAVASLSWLRDAVSPELDGYRGDLGRALSRLRETSPAYAAHEYLEGENHPQRVADFLAEAGEAGLSYLGDAIPGTVAVETLPPEARTAVDRLDVVRAQQTIDFVRCTAFRRALLVRSDTTLARGWRWPRALEPGAVASLRVASRLRPEGGGLFTGPSGSVRIGSPLVARALARLADAVPRALPFADLAEGANDRDRGELASEILELCLATDGVDLHDHDPPLAATLSERPRGCPLARFQVARDEPVTNRWHQEVRLIEPVVRATLARADGTRSVAALAAAMDLPEDAVVACLEVLRRAALLVE
jgi:SAM-dependent methyltransferase